MRLKSKKSPKMVESHLKIKHSDQYDDEPEAKYANGGEVSEKDAQNDNDEHPEGLEQDDDQERPAADEYMANKFADGGEIEDEDDASIAAACMAKRRYARGGQVDLSQNADEEPNNEDQMSFEALKKENYSESEGLDELDYESKNIGHEREDDHDEDLVNSIRRKMSKRSPISR